MVSYNKATGNVVGQLPFREYCVGVTSPFFENAYIADLIERKEHWGAKWFGVLSPVFFSKALAGGLTVDKIKHDIDRGIRRKIARNVFQSLEIDALGFHPGHKNRNIIKQGARYHGRPNGQVFVDLTQAIFDRAGVAWRVEDDLNLVVYNNYIIARPAIWQKYYDDVLGPCMEVMKNDTEIRAECFRDATYHKSKRMSARLKRDLGVPYYPFHSFICERFWAVFLRMNSGIQFRHFGK